MILLVFVPYVHCVSPPKSSFCTFAGITIAIFIHIRWTNLLPFLFLYSVFQYHHHPHHDLCTSFGRNWILWICCVWEFCMSLCRKHHRRIIFCPYICSTWAGRVWYLSSSQVGSPGRTQIQYVFEKTTHKYTIFMLSQENNGAKKNIMIWNAVWIIETLAIVKSNSLNL